jgi:cytoskeletal protein RodZ
MANKTKKPTLKRRRHISLIWLILALLIIGAGAFAIYGRDYDRNAYSKTSSSTTKTKSDVGGAAYSTTPLNSAQANAANNARKGSATSSTSTSTLDTTTTNPSLNVIITRVSGSNVYTQVSGTTTGTCSLQATQAGQPTVSATSQVIQNVNSYECQSFNLAANQFASGNWSIVVTLTSGGSTATSETWNTGQ